MTPILLCWPTTSEADVGDVAVEVEPSHQYSVKFCCRCTDDSRGHSAKMVSEMEVHMKKRCVIEFLHAENIAPNDILRRLLEVFRDQTVDVSTVRGWVVRFSSGDNVFKDKPCSGRPCTAVTPRNEERLHQLIHTNRPIATRELCTELNIRFSALETMVATLEYHKVCARCVPRMLTQEHKEYRMQVCLDLLNQYEAKVTVSWIA